MRKIVTELLNNHQGKWQLQVECKRSMSFAELAIQSMLLNYLTFAFVDDIFFFYLLLLILLVDSYVRSTISNIVTNIFYVESISD
jgi:hypothetical protein